MRNIWFPLALLIGLASCEASLEELYGTFSRDNADYCESATDVACTARAPSDGIPWRCDSLLHRCVPAGSCPFGAHSCVTSDLPICNEGTCVACAAEPTQGDAECAARGEMRRNDLRICALGSCRECRAASDCPTTRPVCQDHACRSCTAHSDCASGICRRNESFLENTAALLGTCVSIDAISEVDSGCAASGDGSRALPYCTINEALQRGRRFLRLHAGMAPYPALMLMSQSVILVGADPLNPPHWGSVIVQAGSLVLDQIVLDAPVLGDAVTCGDSASLSLNHVTVRAAAASRGRGVVAEPNCLSMTVEQSWIEGVGGYGLAVLGSRGGVSTTYRIVNTALHACGSTDPQFGSAAAFLGSGAQGLFSFNTLAQNLDAIECQGNQPIQGSVIVGGGIGGCQTDVVGDLGADIDPTSLKLLDTPRNQACCIDRARPESSVSVDFFGNPRGLVPDRGFHERQ